MNFATKLEEQIRKVISGWDDAGIYAISFLLTANESSVYDGVHNFPEFSVGYNTEADCNEAEPMDEERWNYAYWSQNNVVLIDGNHPDMANALLQWYADQGITDVGTESEGEMYDEDFNYIGKGPRGYWELLSLISDIARKLQAEGFIKERFGNIPILVHDLDYSWYTAKMTENANPGGEAKVFLEYMSDM